MFGVELDSGVVVLAESEHDFLGAVDVSVYGPNRQLIDSNRVGGEASGGLTLTISRDGTYYVKVAGVQQAYGSYDVTLTEESWSTPTVESQSRNRRTGPDEPASERSTRDPGPRSDPLRLDAASVVTSRQETHAVSVFSSGDPSFSRGLRLRSPETEWL